MSGPPDRMILQERSELKFLFGKNLLQQLLESLVKLAAIATGLGEDETTFLDVFAQVPTGKLRKLRGSGGR